MSRMVLATTLLCSLSCTPQPGPPPAQNAADAWNELFVELDDIPFVEHKDGFQIPYYENDVWNDEAHALRMQISPFIDRVREISAMDYCDWELDYSQVLDLPVPHFGHLRQIQKMLLYSMCGEIATGDTSSALSDMRAMLGITHHNTETKTLIGALVSTSGFQLATTDEHLVDMATDASQLEALLATVEEFEAVDSFGLRENIGKEQELTLNWLKNAEDPDFASITGQETDISELDMDEEIARYSLGMERMESIFQMTDKDAALAAAEQLDAELKNGGLGFLASTLCPLSKNLLLSAFRGEEMVAEFKQLLQNKIDMLRNPNSATYFLKAVDAYNEIDSKDRMKAMQHGKFEVFEEPFNLFATACSMPPKQITLANSPETPHWIAPLYSLALDCIARGTSSDRLAIMEFVGHLSHQDRFAASILAAKLFDYD